MYKSFSTIFVYAVGLLMFIFCSCGSLPKECLDIVGLIEKGQIRSDIPRPLSENPWRPRPPQPFPPPCKPPDWNGGGCTTTGLLENIVIVNNDQLFTLTIKDSKGEVILQEKMVKFKKVTRHYRLYSIKEKLGSIDNATIELTVTNKDGSNPKTISKRGIGLVKG